jgi:hypothetical protein
MWPSHRLTSAPSWDSGDGMGRFTHWSHPGGGESSSGISTATARAGERGLLLRPHSRFRPRLRGRGLPLRNHGRCLRLRLSGRWSRVALHDRRRNRCRRLCLRLWPCLCRGRRPLRLLHDRRPPLLSNRRL